jgi:hypothetical protein
MIVVANQLLGWSQNFITRELVTLGEIGVIFVSRPDPSMKGRTCLAQKRNSLQIHCSFPRMHSSPGS